MTESSKTVEAPISASEEKVNFVADARLISILGEQLIGSEKVGILELVKNAYDAGASSCVVTLEGAPDVAPNTRTKKDYESLPGPIIEVADDGSGMSHDDLVAGWLRPATARRARIKERLRIEREAAEQRGSLKTFDALVDRLKEAHGGRLPLGEKGIGRLAAHRLGRFLWLRTKTKHDPFEWELKIDWNHFESLGDTPVDLDKVELTLRHQPPTVEYGNKGHGTVICCYGGRSGYQWTRDQIADVGRSVTGLRSPRHAPEGFEPSFVSPHVSDDELASPLERVAAPFELIVMVDENGRGELEVHFTAPAALAENLTSFKHEENVDLRASQTKAWKADRAYQRRGEGKPSRLEQQRREDERYQTPASPMWTVPIARQGVAASARMAGSQLQGGYRLPRQVRGDHDLPRWPRYSAGAANSQGGLARARHLTDQEEFEH